MKENENKNNFRLVVNRGLHVALAGIVIGLVFSLFYEWTYQNRVYPGVEVAGRDVGGKKREEVVALWMEQNEIFTSRSYELHFENFVTTISGELLEPGYDATLSATQAYSVGRTGAFFSDLYYKLIAPPDLAVSYRWNSDILDRELETLASKIREPVQDALFTFAKGRVTAFRPSKSGRELRTDKTKEKLEAALANFAQNPASPVRIPLVVETINPTITTDQVNSFGIRELIGTGYSVYTGSIAGRVHNLLLAASRINGVLIKPGETFSFNKTVGDISAATGYQSAYIIKDGRTVLGDGGGVCQVSTTLFRAALSAGLPIVERHAHAYRVHFYEDGGFKPGLDATVYSPTYDFAFKNDTPGYILIQAKPDRTKQTLTFEIYGTSDGRKSEILNQKTWDVTPPPPDLYQDDPTLPVGVVKQVDWAAWGAKASFQYKVTRNNEVIQDKTFISNFRPWQAVYLRGTQ